VRLDEHGDLVIPPLTAEGIRAGAAELKEELTGLLPFAPLASVLIELDRRTGFLDCFTPRRQTSLRRIPLPRPGRSRLAARLDTPPTRLPQFKIMAGFVLALAVPSFSRQRDHYHHGL
jgi:hypothetical protein